MNPIDKDAALSDAQSPKALREAILQRVGAVPAFPAVAHQILRLARQDDSNVQDIVALAEHDLGLTANVLRAANAACFASGGQIGSLHEAIVRLGLNRLVEFVLVSLTAPLNRQEVRGYDLAPGRLLEHSILVGVGVEAFAEEAGSEAPQRGFTAGLLHDIGKVVLGSFVDADSSAIQDLAFLEEVSFEEAESRVLGINHAEVGGLVLEHWNFPPDITCAVRFHHAPDAAPPDSPLVDWVHLADHLALESGVGAGVDGLNYRTSAAVIERVNPGQLGSERILCKMLDGLRSFQELIQLS